MMGSSIGDVRESLFDAIEKVKKHSLAAEDAAAIAQLASQISLSLQVEAKLRDLDANLGRQPIGSLRIGGDVIEMAPTQKKLEK